MNVTVTVAQAGPVTVGFPLNKTDNFLNTSNLRVKAPGGAVIPAAFTPMTRWDGLVSDNTKALKFVLIDFHASAAGVYSVDDSNATAASAPTLTVTNAADIRVQTSALDIRFAKTGADLLTQFILSSVEQLAAGAKPQLVAPLATTRCRVRRNSTESLTSAFAAQSGQNKVTVNDGALFQVGDQIRITSTQKLASTVPNNANATIDMDGDMEWYWGDFPGRQLILARGTARETILDVAEINFLYFWPQGEKSQIHPRTSWSAPKLAQLTALLVGDTVEDKTALDDFTANGAYTVTAITGNELTLNRNLGFSFPPNYEVSKVGASAVAGLKAYLQSATVEEQNTLRTVIKQSGWFGTGQSARKWGNLTFDLRWYVYANSNFVRGRLHLLNLSNSGDEQVQHVLFDEMSLVFPTASAATAKDVAIATYTAAATRINSEGLSNVTNETATAGSVKLAVPYFCEFYPSRIVGTGSELRTYLFPPAAGVTRQFWKHYDQTWDFYFGENADQGLPLSSAAPAVIEANYACQTQAYGLWVAQKNWAAGDFGGSTELAEAANRAERLVDCLYEINACDTQGELGVRPRSTIAEYRLSSLLYAGGSHDMGQMLGWDVFGNLRSDQDGWTQNRYDIPYAVLRQWVRNGNAKAFRIGAEHARYQANAGTWKSDTYQNGLSGYNFNGLSRYERGARVVSGVQNPTPSHSWSGGLWLHWAITGDPISKEAALRHATRAYAWNYSGVDPTQTSILNWYEFNEARGVGWSSLELWEAWNYTGDIQYFNRCKQYCDHLRLNEAAQGNKGVYVASGFTLNNGSNGGTAPFIWAGYNVMGCVKLVRDLIRQGTPDTPLQNFLIRIADWLLKGDATAGSNNGDAPLVGGTGASATYQPLSAVRQWWPLPDTTAYDTLAGVVDADISIPPLIVAARVSARSDLRQLADRAFRDVCRYRDLDNNSGNATRNEALASDYTKINGGFNMTYRSSSMKVAGQTGLALLEYIPDAITSLPVPTLTSINPTTRVAGDPQFTLTVNGTAFTADAVVRVDGVTMATTFVNATQLTATITAGAIATAGAKAVTVQNIAGASNSVTLTVTAAPNPAPTLSSISPTNTSAGSAQFTLTVNGSNFVNGSIVRWNGSDLVTTVVSATQLTAIVPAGLVASQGTATVTVFNPAPGGGTSSGQTFTIGAAPSAPAPVIISISPAAKFAGDAQFTLTVNGEDFVSGSIVRINGQNRATTFVSDTQLTATITAGDIAIAGTRAIDVLNPDSQNSNDLTLTVNAAPAPTITSLSPGSVLSGSPQITLTVNGTNYLSSSIVRVNGVDRATTFVSATQLTAIIPESLLAQPGTLSITIANPGAVSSATTLTVTQSLAPLAADLMPARMTLRAYQQATFDMEFGFVHPASGHPFDLSGCTAEMVVQDRNQRTLMLLDQSNGGIVLTQPNKIRMRFQATANLKWRRGFFALRVTRASDGLIARLLEGDFRIAR